MEEAAAQALAGAHLDEAAATVMEVVGMETEAAAAAERVAAADLAARQRTIRTLCSCNAYTAHSQTFAGTTTGSQGTMQLSGPRMRTPRR